MKEILSAGVDVNVKSPLRRTALSCTVDRDCEDAAEELLQQGATMWYGTIRPRASLTERIKLNEYLKDVHCPFLVEIMENGAAKTLTMLIESMWIRKKEVTDTEYVLSLLEKKGCISSHETLGLTKTIIMYPE